MSLASVNISNELIKPILEAEIKGAIARALGNSDALINAAVDSVMNKKVNENGRVSSYSSENKHTVIDVVFQQTIMQVAKEELVNWAKENAGQIRAAIQKHLSIKKNHESFAKAVVDGVIGCMENNYKLSVSMNFKTNAEY